MNGAFHHALSRLNQAAHGPQEGRKTDTRTVSLHDLRQLLDDWNRLDDAVRTLTPKVEALQLDADRYHWLRDKSQPPSQFYLSVPLWCTGLKFRPEDVDKAIDAMCKGEPS